MKRAFILGLFLILCISFVNAHPRSTKPFEYDRIDEVKKECASIFPPDFDHKPYGDRLYRLPEKLSFDNGDWWQDSDKAPLIPYDDKPNGYLDQSSPLNLISFWITDVDDAHRSKNSVSVNGVLRLGIMMGELFSSKPFDRYPIFNIYPGRSELRMSFQGIVTYNNGEIVMCLLGNAFLPSRDPDSSNPWDWVKEPGYINQPPHIHDDRILLVIHYPDTFTVKKRGIHGSLKSLNPKSSERYFDEIHISASLSRSVANYEFSSQKLISKACKTSNYKASFADKNLGAFKGANFCRILERFLSEDHLTVVPTWRCDGTDEFCSKLGPFESGASVKATNYGSLKGVTLHLQDVRCERTPSKGKDGGFTKVAMVIRAASPSDAFYIVPQRTGLNNMTLSAEGMWDPSSGQLCMVGCRGLANKERDATCDSRICLYIPLSFSVKQRSIILGSISSLEKSNTSYFPLSFEKRVHYAKIYNQYYEYSMVELARAVLQKHERFSLETVIRKSFLTFPKVKHAESFLVSLSLLAEDLTLNNPAVPVPELSAPSCCRSPTDVEIEILSLGQMFGLYRSMQKDSIVEEDMTTRYIDSQLGLNVSAQLSLTGPEYGNFSDLFLEGLYQPLVGKMYLVGCRDVRAYSNLLYENTDLEDGFDCRIEVVVSYPPTTNRWLVNPTVRVSIASQRNELDPLFFRPIKLQTVLVMHQLQRGYISSSRGVEGMLQVLTPLIAIGCILSQLFYINENLDSVPYVSLVMLAVQALGYGFPLVTGVESLVESNENSSAYTTNQRIQVIDYKVKIVVLISFLLTLRLYQKVWRSRIRLISRDVLEPHVPSDRPGLLVTLLIHVFGFGCFLIVYKLQSWPVEFKEYLGLVQDFFLLPQVIGNLIWQIDCKPLRKSYFVGLTVIRLLPHVCGYRLSAIQYPSEVSEIVPPYLDFYSKQGVIGIPATAILLAIVVHVQQKWSYENLGRIFTFGKFKLLPRRSMAYERLPPMAAEGEVNSGLNGVIETLQRRRGWK